MNGEQLRYKPRHWDSDYVHQTRCGLMSCRLVYFRFDDDKKIRILRPRNRKDLAIPDTQPEGFPLEPIASESRR